MTMRDSFDRLEARWSRYRRRTRRTAGESRISTRPGNRRPPTPAHVFDVLFSLHGKEGPDGRAYRGRGSGKWVPVVDVEKCPATAVRAGLVGSRVLQPDRSRP